MIRIEANETNEENAESLQIKPHHQQQQLVVAPETTGPIDTEGFQLLIDDGSLKKKILREGEEGDGTPFTEGTFVTVHYIGTLMDGTVFDSSRKRNKPFEFKIGKGQVIPGWDIGVPTMKIKEVAILVCAPELAYGHKGSKPHIKPNTTICFEIEVLSATPPHRPLIERISEAKTIKGNANDLYSEEKYENAIDLYKTALQMIEYSWGALPHEEKEVQTLQIQLYSNLSACHLNTENYEDCVAACEAVLDMDNKNVKALFRLGKAKKCKFDFVEAMKYLKMADNLNGQKNPAIKKEIESTKKEHKAFTMKEKQTYGAMFKEK